jgi:hypothetical protein
MSATTKVWADDSPPSVNAVDLNGFKNENNLLITGAGLTPNTGDNQQTHKAVQINALAADSYVDSGVVNAYVLTRTIGTSPATAYFNAMRVCFIASAINTGVSTVNVSSLGVKAIKKIGGAALSSGDIKTNRFTQLRYNTSAGYFELGVETQATTTVKGVVELATNAEGVTGTDTQRAMTPAATAAAIAAIPAPGPGGDPIRAWVVFNGDNGNIFDDENVTSVTRLGAGHYQVFFTTAFADTLYSATAWCRDNDVTSISNLSVSAFQTDIKTTSTMVFRTFESDDNLGHQDSPEVSLHFFGRQ